MLRCGAVGLVVVGLCLSFAGCGGGGTVKGPATVPIKGRVEGPSVKDLADRSVAVEFESIEQPGMKAYGLILDDGSFTMTTQFEGAGKPGVVAGTHRVRLNADDSGARYIAPQFLRYETSGITVKAPSDGDIVIKVSR